MQKINYPLLYYPFSDGKILGILVGTDYQVIEGDLRKVKGLLLDHLQKQYRKHDFYPYFEIETPRLKIFRVDVRPTYREQQGSYPLTYSLKVPIPVIYGQISQDYYACYLPLFEQSFYYYDPRQFESLVRHFAVNQINQYPPEKIFQLISYPKPELEIISLRVNADKPFNWSKFEYRRKFRTLQRLADRYPPSKAGKKAGSALPEAAWEMENKVNEVVNKVMNTRSNILVVGNPGVGKSAVLKHAMRKMAQLTKKRPIKHSFWRIMPQRITASAKYLGDWEENIENLVEELSLANGVLWVIDVIQLLLTGGSGPEDSIAAFLTSFLQQGKLQIIGEATPQELNSMRRLLPGFVEYFQVINIEDPVENKVQAILDRFVTHIQEKHGIRIDPDALSLTYRLLLRFYPYESFPGKGIRFLGQCVSEAKISERTVIGKKEVIEQFITQTGMPELFLRDDLLLDVRELRTVFDRQIIGQPNAVGKICEIVKVFKAGLNNPNRPVSTLIFAGPTGVGKTASAKALADYFFGKGQGASPLIRIDMSEFQTPGQISRLIGIGREVGKLVKEIRERPFSVLLLDEVEKANPSIFDALLTVIDEGMLTDAYGRITNFRNTIIIMTTNLGATNRKAIGFSQTTNEDLHYVSAIEKYFRPEFVNRIDGIITFSSLEEKDVRLIARKELEELKKREGFEKRSLELTFHENLIEHLVRVGFDERYGARPLQRAIEQNIVAPVANWLLENPEIENRSLRLSFGKRLVIEPSP